MNLYYINALTQRWIFSTNHKDIALQQPVIGGFSGILVITMFILILAEITQPGNQILNDNYIFLMVFFMVMLIRHSGFNKISKFFFIIITIFIALNGEPSIFCEGVSNVPVHSISTSHNRFFDIIFKICSVSFTIFCCCGIINNYLIDPTPVAMSNT